MFPLELDCLAKCMTSTEQINRGSYALTQSSTVEGTSTVRIAFQLFANSSTGVGASEAR